MDALSKRDADCSGKFDTTAGEALRLLIERTAGNHLYGDQNANGT